MKNNQMAPVTARLDELAILTMLAAAVIGLFTMAFQYTKYKPCSEFRISTSARQYHSGEPIRFETNARNPESLHWDFGDNEFNDTKLPSAVHAYDTPGEYTIALTVDGTCTEYSTILVTPAPVVENPALLPAFICPGSATVGKAVSFEDTTGGAYRWEWRFGESGSVDATSQKASYTFTTPGLKTVSLLLNNDPRQIGVCKLFVNMPGEPARPQEKNRRKNAPQQVIVVKEKPDASPLNEQLPQEKPAPDITAPAISANDFEQQLRAVANKYYGADHFLKYTCGRNVPVTLNDKETDFEKLCQQLASLKNDRKIRKLSVHLIKNEKTNCIESMIITLKTKDGLLNKIF
ncbi:MAG: PKD domain-containing protein [Flavihumibacter sp.]